MKTANFKLFRCKGMFAIMASGSWWCLIYVLHLAFASLQACRSRERQRKMLAQGKSPHRHKSRLQDNEGDANAIMNVHLLWVLSKFVCCERRLDIAGFPRIGDEENNVSLEIFQFQGEIFTLQEVFRHSAASSIGEDNKSEGSEKLTHSIQKNITL